MGATSDTLTILILLLDANEYRPIFMPSVYNSTIPESMLVGSTVLKITATDQDGGSVYGNITQYTIIPLTENVLPFGVTSEGEIEVVAPLDYDVSERKYRFQVSATDGGGMLAESSAEVFIELTNVNDLPPVFIHSEYNFTTPEISL